MKKLRDQIELGHRGELGWHRMLIVDDGLKAKQLGLAQSDMEFVKQRKWTLKQIAGAFGVPPPFLGETDETNKATIRELTLLFWNNTIIPKLLKIESAFNNFIMPRFGPGIVVAFDLADIRALKADEAAKAEMGKILIASGQMTPNEVRNRLWSLPDRSEPGAAMIYLPLSIHPLAGEGMEQEAGDGAGTNQNLLPPGSDDDPPDDEGEEEAQDDDRDAA
jgi:HK97 family phage portal protein